jgi:hypothetical protein
MLAVLSVEVRKLNRSLAAVLAVAAPALIAVLLFFVVLRGSRVAPWNMFLESSTMAWAFFMLPMSVTALTALVAHMEHAPRAWDHLRALPTPRWKIYAAKAICVIALVTVMSGLNLLLTWGSISAAVMIKPAVTPSGTLDVAKLLIMNLKVVAAATLMIAIQLSIPPVIPALVAGTPLSAARAGGATCSARRSLLHVPAETGVPATRAGMHMVHHQGLVVAGLAREPDTVLGRHIFGGDPL